MVKIADNFGISVPRAHQHIYSVQHKNLQRKDRIKLVPANHTMKPFYETNVVIQGKVVGVLRKEI